MYNETLYSPHFGHYCRSIDLAIGDRHRMLMPTEGDGIFLPGMLHVSRHRTVTELVYWSNIKYLVGAVSVCSKNHRQQVYAGDLRSADLFEV
ncbi:unnamed protein product [Zymoseptoria tritici ST99CH_1A5]|uniref:Uncharacterized protein n=2 Tax=Zymoseptoria tritici TaxID=1047171 RepID=A0A2H1FLQ4_ZYMTR|nr:unnamed protein product [Zymoseptoria tritici ST99CH_1E4]SMY19581.1 unnamed protein product [Zymoseptoria tritici ST99CH_1A5]